MTSSQRGHHQLLKRLTISHMTIANNMFNGIISKEAFRPEVFPRRINDDLELGERYRNIIFVGLAFF